MPTQMQILDPLPDGTERWRGLAPSDFGTLPDGKVLVGGARDKWRCGFNSAAEVANAFTVDAGDNLVRYDGDTAGSRYLSLTRSSISAAAVEASIVAKKPVNLPTRLGFGISMNQRIHGEMFVIEQVGVDDSGKVIEEAGRKTFCDPVSIYSASVSSNVLTVGTTVDHNLKVDDLVVIYGNVVDTRMNTFGKVTTVNDPRTFQLALTNANTSFVVSGALVSKIEPAGTAASGFGLLIDGTSSSTAWCWSKSSGSPASIGTAQTLGSSWTDPLTTVSSSWCVSRTARFTTELMGTSELVRYVTYSSDALSGPGGTFKRTQNIPEPDRKYVMRIRAVTMPNAMPPVEILSAVKTGTTTATVQTATPHGLQTGAYVRLYGPTDATNFPTVLSEVPVTVTAADTFTVTWGPAATATTYGGAVKPVFSGMTTGLVSSAVPRAAYWFAGRMWLGLSASWSPYMGETVRLLGMRNNAGSLGMDGQYRVVAVNPAVTGNFLTTTGSAVVTATDTSKLAVGMIVSGTGIAALTIASIVPNTSFTLSGNATVTGTTWLTLQGLVLEPLSFAPKADGVSVSLTTTSGGCSLTRETDLGIHFVRALDYTRTPVEVTGGNHANDQGLAVQTAVVNTVNATAAEGTPYNPTTHTLSSAASTNATLVKSTSGIVYNLTLTNFGATSAFFKLYNKASAPTVGTDIPDMVLEVPAGKSVIFPFERFGYRGSAGLAYAITGAQAIADTTAVAASQVRVALSFV